MRRAVAASWMFLACSWPAIAHDIPNAKVERSIQATLLPGLIRVDYEVSLSELTLTQDLRQLIGELPGADRRGWFEEYGRVTGPLNARGLLASIDGGEVDLAANGFDLVVEGHPRFTFHFEASVPSKGRLMLNDTNYVASEGTSRLAIRGVDGVAIRGDPLPPDVGLIPIRPVWQLSDAEERRTRRVAVDYSIASTPSAIVAPPPRPAIVRTDHEPAGLSRLLDGAGGRGWLGLLLAAFVLGAAHAIQPGHGKAIVAASSLGPGGGPLRGATLGLATAVVHLSSVAMLAGVLWAIKAARPGEIHLALARSSGFVIAAVGVWRLGRHLAGFGEHEARDGHEVTGRRGLLALAMAGGIVPCWDAVALVVLSEAIGRLTLGLALLAAFSLGMAAVLVGVGAGSSRLRSWLDRLDGRAAWERRLGILGGVLLTGIGLSMLRD